MMRTTLSAVALIAIVAAPQGIRAQERPLNGGRDTGGPGGAGVRSGNITSTGATVPHPGESQSGGTTSLDKGVEREDNKIQGSICKGC